MTFRPAGTRDSSGRNKVVDENYNNVSSPSRGGLAGKLQQLLTPTRHRVSVRRAASVDDRRPGGGGIGRRVSEQRQSRKAQVAETLLKAKERLVSATSEVWTSSSSNIVQNHVVQYFHCASTVICSITWFHVVLSQSSLSVGSDLDLTDTPSPAYPLRRSWDANQEGTGLEVNGSLSGSGCSSLRGFVVS